LLSGGNDGARPTSDDFQGIENLAAAARSGLRAFEDIEEISTVAAPGATFGFRGGYEENASGIMNHLIAHAERMRYRIAVLDSGDGLGTSEVRGMRARFDSKSAALYYPWIRTHDPITGQDINLPPSGFVAGIYARNDIENGVSKAPANQVVTSAIGMEVLLNETQQKVLNPEGINCLRAFEGRGVRVWGARTISSDPEWKYVSVRRYCAYLEHSIDRGTQWVVFEPNGEALWAAVRRSIEDFLLTEWRNGALMGDKPENALFIRCDRSTMTQNDLDNGRLICLIGVALLRPAEFVIVRIGLWTADRKC
jgi:phage tail sheath protein FI